MYYASVFFNMELNDVVVFKKGWNHMAADYILKSKNVFTGTDDVPCEACVIVSGDKILDVVSADEAEQYQDGQTTVIDYGDKLILPGFLDSHNHIGMCMDMVDESFCIDVTGCTCFEEVMGAMKKFGEQHPDNKVVYGVNLNLFDMNDGFIPTRKAMDRYFPDRPALLWTWDMHTYYANTKAIELAGITKDTPDPNNGIGKDANGELDGSFNDEAAFMMQKVVHRPDEERKNALRIFMKKLNECGVTSVSCQYPCGAVKPYPLYKLMEDELTARINFFTDLFEFTPENAEAYKKEYNSPMLQFSGLKVLLDGVLTVFTAWMLEPYTNNPTVKGFPSIPKEKMKEKIFEAVQHGYNVRVHTIGDQAVRYALDVFEEAEKKYGKIDRRHAMEHIENINPADIPRFAQLGVIASMQLRHAIFYVDDAIKYVGPERVKYCFNWRSILDTGAIIGTGSDYPVSYFNPMLGIHAGVTRTQDDGHPEGGWIPEQRITLAECIRAYTYGSACIFNRESELGTLEKGKLADVTVLDRNLFEIPTHEILETKPVMTMTGGKIVFERS